MSNYEHDVERVNRVLERAAQDPKIQQVIADARMFDALRQDPGWRRLYDIVAAQKGRWMDKLAKRLMYGPKPTPEEIAYYRGFYEGAYFVLVHPEVAESNLERAAQIAWTLAGEDDEDTEEVYT